MICSVLYCSSLCVKLRSEIHQQHTQHNSSLLLTSSVFSQLYVLLLLLDVFVFCFYVVCCYVLFRVCVMFFVAITYCLLLTVQALHLSTTSFGDGRGGAQAGLAIVSAHMKPNTTQHRNTLDISHEHNTHT